jgi:hypothetical protein
MLAAPYGATAAPPEPVVAVHVSELTQALETIPAPTRTGSQWWYPSWRYFVAHESLTCQCRSRRLRTVPGRRGRPPAHMSCRWTTSWCSRQQSIGRRHSTRTHHGGRCHGKRGVQQPDVRWRRQSITAGFGVGARRNSGAALHTGECRSSSLTAVWGGIRSRGRASGRGMPSGVRAFSLSETGRTLCGRGFGPAGARAAARTHDLRLRRLQRTEADRS